MIARQFMKYINMVRAAHHLIKRTAGPEARPTRLFGVNRHPAAQ